MTFNIIMIVMLVFGVVLIFALPRFDLGIKSDFIKSGIGILVSLLGLLAQLPNSRKKTAITKLQLIKKRWIEGDDQKRLELSEKMENLLFNIN
ncbi:MAG: hypothetical protein AAF363_08355 [Bacteroidota bacterium]